MLSLATALRLTRTSVVENLRADYVRTAIAKGLTRRRIVGIHQGLKLFRQRFGPFGRFQGRGAQLLARTVFHRLRIQGEDLGAMEEAH